MRLGRPIAHSSIFKDETSQAKACEGLEVKPSLMSPREKPALRSWAKPLAKVGSLLIK